MTTENNPKRPFYPLLLSRKEACRLLGIGASTYKQLVAGGSLREVQIGNRGRRLPYSEAVRFAERPE